jgi:hypothetical protein
MSGRGRHNAHGLGAEDLVERPGELGVPIPDEDLLLIEASGDREVADPAG